MTGSLLRGQFQEQQQKQCCAARSSPITDFVRALEDGAGTLNSQSFGQRIARAFKQAGSNALWCFVFEDLIPAGRYLFRTEVVPAAKRKLHELTNDTHKPAQVIEAESMEAVPTIEELAAATPSNNIIRLADYRKAINQ